jgi:hypothetical protein
MKKSPFTKKHIVVALFLAATLPSCASELSSTATASAGLITIATTGNPVPLHAELGGTIISSAALQKKVGPLLKLEKNEHLAPKALITSTGETYAMVAPTITKDNFILVDQQGNTMRMDVGQTEGHQIPFVVQTLTDLSPSLAGPASQGLITIATTGNPEPLHTELGGTIISSEALQNKASNLLNLTKNEHLAPKALVAPNGETYAMVAPTITKDNFIFVDKKGNVARMDVGHTEGHYRPFVVRNIVEDGGTPWYTEFWYWVTGQ